MFRLATLLALVPTFAAAEWSPLPRGFSYDATFAGCTIDPDQIDLDACAASLHDAFVLNRAVTAAVMDCAATPLRACALPFEDRGLPSIAARIAADSACDTSAPATFPAFTPLPDDHCITMISDILRDEGVMPLDLDATRAPSEADQNCTLDALDCDDLRAIHATFWYTSVLDLSDTPNTRLRSDTAWNACLAVTRTDAAVEECHIVALADIWADLTLAMKEDN